MNVHLRFARQSDLPFMRQMLYEAVFWRASDNRPSLEEGLAYPGVSPSLADWGERTGDTAVIATSETGSPVGAAWYRYWTDDNYIRGYINEAIPALVIGVHRDCRHRGIGTKMLQWLIDYAAHQAIQQMSLMVSKDNGAINLYRQQGFREYADKGDSLLMMRKIQTRRAGRVRPYEERDTEAIIDAWYQASLIAHPFLTADFLAQENKNLRELFLPRSQTWVFEKEGQIGGFISLLDNIVGGIFVHPSWQRQGVGTALMNKAKSLHTTLELDVFTANKQGRAFYAKYGFEPLKTYRDEATGEMMLKLRFVGGQSGADGLA